jgi:hypothetical protein
VIALVGMVNAGKSTLGNLLLDGQKARFAVNSIRETATAAFGDWGNDAVLSDLPGIGSIAPRRTMPLPVILCDEVTAPADNSGSTNPCRRPSMNS